MKKLLHAEIQNQRLSIEQALSAPRHPVSLILQNIRSLYNVGSIFRTADAALAESIVLCGFTPYPPRKEIEKTSLGAVQSVPWTYEKNILKAIEIEKNKNKKVIAIEITNKGVPYFNLSFDDFPLSLLLGNDLTGIDSDALALCDGAVEIPMFGVKHSLNVSVAAGIVLFECVRVFRSQLK